MGVFDEYRALCFKYPRAMNYLMMNLGLFSVLYFGKGIEKMNVNHSGNQRAYESSRRAHRFYVPYFIANYKWRFPENK